MISRFSILTALALALLFLFSQKEQPASPPSVQTESRADFAPPQAPPSPSPASRPDSSPEAVPLLFSLRESYLSSGSKATRFKSQRALDQLWSANPPLDLILFESLDPSAPPEYRSHFANRIRKIGKISAPEEKALLSSKIRLALSSPHYSTASKSLLAAPLIAFHDAPGNLRTVSSLIPESPDDLTSATLLSALSLSKSPLAREALENFTAAHANDPDSHRYALRAALPPLVRDPAFAIAPSFEKIFTLTSNPEFLRFSIGQLFFRPPSAETLPLVSLALQRSAQFPSSDADQIKSLISGGLARWTSQQNSLSPENVHSINKIKTDISR